jgi:hypothetical protein
MPKRHPDDFFDDDKAYRDRDLIESGYAKAKSTIQSWEERFAFPRGRHVGRTKIRTGRELNDWDRSRRSAQTKQSAATCLAHAAARRAESD